jgi:hypothetical protein
MADSLNFVGLRVLIAWIGFKKGVRWKVFKYLLGVSRRFLKRIYAFFSTEKLSWVLCTTTSTFLS